MSWRNRIAGRDHVDPRELAEHPANWRVHDHDQRAQMTAILDTVGFVQGVTVNRRTSTILDGHMRVALAIQRDEPTIPVTWVDLDVEEERVALATLDPLKMLARADDRKFAALRDDVAARAPALAMIADRDRAASVARATATRDDVSPPDPGPATVPGDDDLYANGDTTYNAVTDRHLRFVLMRDDYHRVIDVIDHVIVHQPDVLTAADALAWLIDTYGTGEDHS